MFTPECTQDLLAVFVAFDVLNEEDEKPGGDNEEMDQKKGWKGLFQQHGQGIGDQRYGGI